MIERVVRQWWMALVMLLVAWVPSPAAASMGTPLDVCVVRAAPGMTAAFAIRPEKLRLSRQVPGDIGVNALRGTVWDIAYLGDVTLFNVKLDGGTMVRSTVINASRIAPEPIGWDEEVWLTFPRDAGLVLVQ